jgi:hypothetical protein
VSAWIASAPFGVSGRDAEPGVRHVPGVNRRGVEGALCDVRGVQGVRGVNAPPRGRIGVPGDVNISRERIGVPGGVNISLCKGRDFPWCFFFRLLVEEIYLEPAGATDGHVCGPADLATRV